MKKLFLLILTCSSLVYSQNSQTEKIHSWFDFNGSHKFNEQWKVYGDVGYRIVFIEKKFHRLYIRPSGSFQLNSIFILHGGIGLFTTFDTENTLWEFRPFQGVEIKWPTVLSIPLNHYFRFEERFFSGNTINTFLFRGRYRLATTIQFNQTRTGNYFYTPLQLEWFVSYGSDIDFQLNEFRGVIGLGYVIDNSWKVELNTIFQNVSASKDLFSFNDIVFRFRIFKEFNP
ncbi:MAG: DUF2490 domain-containing protein [Ignavibacteriaceae bacterium]